MIYYLLFFFFSSRRRHTRYIGDWSSDVCSSDLSVSFTAAFVTALSSATCAAYTSKKRSVVARAMSSNASRYCRSESSALTAFSRRSHAAALGRRMPWRSPMVTGVEDHVSTAYGPLTVSRASAEVTNSAPPLTGSVWDRLRLRAAFVWSWGRNRVLPSGCSTGMIDRL